MTIQQQIIDTFEATRLLNPKFVGCEICGVMHPKRGMTFHHHWYLKSDKTYKDFPKNPRGLLAYYKEVYKQVKRNPKRFALLCVRHHYDVERSLKYGDKHWEKLTEFRKLSRAKR